MAKEKVILAYSGGLDTTAIIPWLKENYDYDVVCCCVDCGQESELDGLDERAKLSGAEKLYIEDITDDFNDPDNHICCILFLHCRISFLFYCCDRCGAAAKEERRTLEILSYKRHR